MALRKIRIQGEEILSKRAKEIPEITPRIKELAADMIETMYDAEGVGLAGPQVGILRRALLGRVFSRVFRARPGVRRLGTGSLVVLALDQAVGHHVVVLHP